MVLPQGPVALLRKLYSTVQVIFFLEIWREELTTYQKPTAFSRQRREDLNNIFRLSLVAADHRRKRVISDD
jgi:hypothetical protein